MKHAIPDSVLDDRNAFVGTSGSGKTFGAGTAVERLLDKQARVVIVDPLDVWWGLRLAADGKTPAYPIVIFGGTHGDLPITEHAGALIGETVASMAESCIVSLGGFATKSAERRFMLAFLDALYRKATGEPFTIVFDEADLWAPQKSSEPMLQNLMEQIVRRGRVKGFVPWLITQRPAVLSKDVLSQADTLVAMKLTSSQDRAAIGAWIEGQADKSDEKRILASLPAMQRGQGILWSPGHGILDQITFPLKKTFDSSRTPKRGEKKKATATLGPVNLDKLREKLSTVEDEVKANDPKALKAEIANLKRQVATTRDVVRDPQEVADAERRGYERGRDDERRRLIRELAPLSSVRDTIDRVLNTTGTAPQPVPLAQRMERQAPKQTATPTRASPSAEGSLLTGPMRKIINAIAWWNAIGVQRPSRIQVAFVAGYKPGTGTYQTYLGGLSSQGFVNYPEPACVALTEAGAAEAAHPDTRPTVEELHERALAILSGPQQKLLRPLLSAYPDALRREDLASSAGYQPGTGTFQTYVGGLSSIGLIEYPVKGSVRAADLLFP